MLIFQIGLGIVFGVFLLLVLVIIIGVLVDYVADNRDWKARRRAFAQRYDHAESRGWVYDPDSVAPVEDQLQRWERKYAAQNRSET